MDDHTDEDVSRGMGGLSLDGGKASGAGEIPDMDDIPDMEEEDLEGEDDAAVAAPKPAAAKIIDAGCVHDNDHLNYTKASIQRDRACEG